MQQRLSDRMAVLEAEWHKKEAARAAESEAAASNLLSLEGKARQVCEFASQPPVTNLPYIVSATCGHVISVAC